MQLFLFNLNFNCFAPRIIRIFFAVLFICTNTYIIILITLGSSERFWSFRWATHLCTQKILFKIRCCGPHNLIARYTTSLFPFYVYFVFLTWFCTLERYRLIFSLNWKCTAFSTDKFNIIGRFICRNLDFIWFIRL